MSDINDETKQAIARSVRAVLIAAVVITAFAWLAEGAHLGVSVMAGGILASLNLIVFARLVRAFLAAGGGGHAASWGVIGALKLVGLFACVFILVKRAGISPIGLAVGYAALPVGITFGTLGKATKA